MARRKPGFFFSWCKTSRTNDDEQSGPRSGALARRSPGGCRAPVRETGPCEELLLISPDPVVGRSCIVSHEKMQQKGREYDLIGLANPGLGLCRAPALGSGLWNRSSCKTSKALQQEAGPSTYPKLLYNAAKCA
ncbi:hypothetical protein PBY51_001138 [Eleginops maclovinus]|uniref:Uncharacterized protein n=1 Tax=Eleginops maclovinus TaxID=56733 RepID=A0AAN8AR39_ELEMC|nr:hypothetical protein PBY51_001138 [Eleginops maclovinus]